MNNLKQNAIILFPLVYLSFVFLISMIIGPYIFDYQSFFHRDLSPYVYYGSLSFGLLLCFLYAKEKRIFIIPLVLGGVTIWLSKTGLFEGPIAILPLIIFSYYILQLDSETNNPTEESLVNFSTFQLLVMAFHYLHILKSRVFDLTWQSGEALYPIFIDNEFSRFAGFFAGLEEYQELFKVLSWLACIIELIIPIFLLFKPTLKWGLYLVIMTHVILLVLTYVAQWQIFMIGYALSLIWFGKSPGILKGLTLIFGKKG